MEKPSLVALRREVSEDEIQVARNFLIQRYGGYKSSVDAIKSAHDGALTRKFG
ncbi:hypothetical protein ACSBR1_013700 [Camellia fascicularis]